MSISSTTRTAGPFTGNDTATVFPFTFKVFAASDLVVKQRDESTLVETTLVLNSDYTVSLNANQNSNPGGSVTLPAVLPTGQDLFVTSDMANLQSLDLTNQGGFYPEVINDALDKVVIQNQQQQTEIDRSVKISQFDDEAALDQLVSDVTRLAESIDGLDVLVSHVDNIDTVAGIDSEVTTVAGIDSEVTTVAGISANVTTVAGVSANVTTVAGISANVSTVAGNTININKVAAVDTVVTAVATIDDEVVAVAGDLTNIDAVAAELPEILTKVSKTSSTGSAILPVGTSAQRDGSPVTGMIRHNTQYGCPEYYNGTFWVQMNMGEPNIGDPFGGGYFAGYISETANGVATHMLIVSPKASGETAAAWDTVGGATTGFNSLIAGPTNSAGLAALGARYAAATFCEGLTINGYSDWYLPARNELEVAYYNLKNVTQANYVAGGNLGNNANAVPPWEPVSTSYTTARPAQTTVDAFKVGGVEAFTDNYFWSSSEPSSTGAWRQSFGSGDPGGQGNDNKTNVYSVRAFRRLAI